MARLHLIAQAALAALAGTNALHAQAQTPPSAPGEGTVLITGKSESRRAVISGFEAPLKELPLSATVTGAEDMTLRGARRLADLNSFDSSVTDAYNAGGYIDYLTVRGFVIDNRYNYRREGLPINAETSIALDNKERVEILKGTSGIQAGTSAPGGLVNYVVKRPVEQSLRELRIEYTGRASVLAAADLGDRFGEGRAFGWRFNVASEQLRPTTMNLDGRRSLLALSTEWRISPATALDAEVEWSHRSQPTQAGYSLLGPVLPAPRTPRLNLNNQPWSLPTVFDGLTGSLRLNHRLNALWRLEAQAGAQRLRTDDRIAFPFGCSAEDAYDRYCSDGSFDLYDFRSENERRQQDAAQIALKGRVDTAGVRHDLNLSLTGSRLSHRFNPQAYNYVGSGRVQGTLFTPADPSLTSPGTNRDERSLEFGVQDALRWTPTFSTWLGLRHTRLQRQSISTEGDKATRYGAGLTTPWLAAGWNLGGATLAYASVGQGVETQVVPNKPTQYSNAGQALPAMKSRQLELGLKGSGAAWAPAPSNAGMPGGMSDDQADGMSSASASWQAALFEIHRPMSNLDYCSNMGVIPCTGQMDGQAVHRGLEAGSMWRSGRWTWGGSTTLIEARRSGSTMQADLNGKQPPNVPNTVMRAQASWRLPQWSGAELHTQWQREGRRAVLPDSSLMLPSWERLDAQLRMEQRSSGMTLRWTLGVDNLLDARYWKESPYQFGHVYLYPGAVRTWRLGVQAEL